MDVTCGTQILYTAVATSAVWCLILIVGGFVWNKCHKKNSTTNNRTCCSLFCNNSSTRHRSARSRSSRSKDTLNIIAQSKLHITAESPSATSPNTPIDRYHDELNHTDFSQMNYNSRFSKTSERTNSINSSNRHNLTPSVNVNNANSNIANNLDPLQGHTSTTVSVTNTHTNNKNRNKNTNGTDGNESTNSVKEKKDQLAPEDHTQGSPRRIVITTDIIGNRNKPINSETNNTTINSNRSNGDDHGTMELTSILEAFVDDSGKVTIRDLAAKYSNTNIKNNNVKIGDDEDKIGRLNIQNSETKQGDDKNLGLNTQNSGQHNSSKNFLAAQNQLQITNTINSINISGTTTFPQQGQQPSQFPQQQLVNPFQQNIINNNNNGNMNMNMNINNNNNTNIPPMIIDNKYNNENGEWTLYLPDLVSDIIKPSTIQGGSIVHYNDLGISDSDSNSSESGSNSNDDSISDENVDNIANDDHDMNEDEEDLDLNETEFDHLDGDQGSIATQDQLLFEQFLYGTSETVQAMFSTFQKDRDQTPSFEPLTPNMVVRPMNNLTTTGRVTKMGMKRNPSPGDATTRSRGPSTGMYHSAISPKLNDIREIDEENLSGEFDDINDFNNISNGSGNDKSNIMNNNGVGRPLEPVMSHVSGTSQEWGTNVEPRNNGIDDIANINNKTNSSNNREWDGMIPRINSASTAINQYNEDSISLPTIPQQSNGLLLRAYNSNGTVNNNNNEYNFNTLARNILKTSRNNSMNSKHNGSSNENTAHSPYLRQKSTSPDAHAIYHKLSGTVTAGVIIHDNPNVVGASRANSAQVQNVSVLLESPLSERTSPPTMSIQSQRDSRNISPSRDGFLSTIASQPAHMAEFGANVPDFAMTNNNVNRNGNGGRGNINRNPNTNASVANAVRVANMRARNMASMTVTNVTNTNTTMHIASLPNSNNTSIVIGDEEDGDDVETMNDVNDANDVNDGATDVLSLGMSLPRGITEGYSNNTFVSSNTRLTNMGSFPNNATGMTPILGGVGSPTTSQFGYATLSVQGNNVIAESESADIPDMIDMPPSIRSGAIHHNINGINGINDVTSNTVYTRQSVSFASELSQPNQGTSNINTNNNNNNNNNGNNNGNNNTILNDETTAALAVAVASNLKVTDLAQNSATTRGTTATTRTAATTNSAEAKDNNEKPKQHHLSHIEVMNNNNSNNTFHFIQTPTTLANTLTNNTRDRGISGLSGRSGMSTLQTKSRSPSLQPAQAPQIKPSKSFPSIAKSMKSTELMAGAGANEIRMYMPMTRLNGSNGSNDTIDSNANLNLPTTYSLAKQQKTIDENNDLSISDVNLKGNSLNIKNNTSNVNSINSRTTNSSNNRNRNKNKNMDGSESRKHRSKRKRRKRKNKSKHRRHRKHVTDHRLQMTKNKSTSKASKISKTGKTIKKSLILAFKTADLGIENDDNNYQVIRDWLRMEICQKEHGLLNIETMDKIILKLEMNYVDGHALLVLDQELLEKHGIERESIENKIFKHGNDNKDSDEKNKETSNVQTRL